VAVQPGQLDVVQVRYPGWSGFILAFVEVVLAAADGPFACPRVAEGGMAPAFVRGEFGKGQLAGGVLGVGGRGVRQSDQSEGFRSSCRASEFLAQGFVGPDPRS
jgi:hypothetical protein